MSNWFFENKHPDATTCFVLGEVDCNKIISSFEKYDYVVWFVCEGGLPDESEKYSNIYPMFLETTDEKKLIEIVGTLINANYNFVPDIFCSKKILENNPASYNLILRHIQIQSEETLRVRKMRTLEGFCSQKNILDNIPYFTQYRFDNRSQNKLSKKPVAIVGAGPSLDFSIDKLKGLTESAYIFSVDSVVTKLYENNIRPDAVFTVDAKKNVSDCLKKDQIIPSLFLSLKSPHNWITSECPNKHFLSANIGTEDWLSENGFSKTIPKIIGNCGITAVNFALFLGCSPIMLFGMDHAIDEDSGQGHAKGINLKVERATFIPEKCKNTVPGNYKPRG